MEGLGNDYIYIDTARFPIADPAALSVRLSDRHFGIGSDGLVLIGASSVADFSMRIFNADGSEAEMCGNASRCIAKWVYERGRACRKQLTLETASGVKTLYLHVDEQDRVQEVSVDMGVFRHKPLPACPVVAGQPYEGLFIDMGNPHYVIFCEDAEQVDVAAIGSVIEHDALFPEGTNVEFADVRSPGRIRMRVWERGSGITLACGTGACATLSAACISGRTGSFCELLMDGGTLRVECNPEIGSVRMTGPARFVFEGSFDIGDYGQD